VKTPPAPPARLRAISTVKKSSVLACRTPRESRHALPGGRRFTGEQSPWAYPGLSSPCSGVRQGAPYRPPKTNGPERARRKKRAREPTLTSHICSHFNFEECAPWPIPVFVAGSQILPAECRQEGQLLETGGPLDAVARVLHRRPPARGNGEHASRCEGKRLIFSIAEAGLLISVVFRDLPPPAPSAAASEQANRSMPLPWPFSSLCAGLSDLGFLTLFFFALMYLLALFPK